MRSLSKVIKPHEIILKAPVFLDIPGKMTQAENLRLTHADHDNTQADAREEADKIIKETEEIIVQLLEKARLQAQNIMAEADEEAQDIRLRAENEAQLLKEQAIDSGYQYGWDKAGEEARQQLEEASRQSKDLLEEANRERLRIIQSCESIIIKMSMGIAQKIVEKELTTNPDIIVKLVGSIMEFMNGVEAFKVLVSPEDFMTLITEFGEHIQSAGGNEKIRILADKTVSRGGCIVETDLGSVDARLETRISSLENALMDVVTYE